MPLLIENIDVIARKKQRDVLWISFLESEDSLLSENNEQSATSFEHNINFKKRKINQQSRERVIAWLDEHRIDWELTGPLANRNVMMPYQGDIYVDLPYDQNLAAYRELEWFLENPDIKQRLPDVKFWVCSLELAMRNKHNSDWDEF
jgi:hypothetical protein